MRGKDITGFALFLWYTNRGKLSPGSSVSQSCEANYRSSASVRMFNAPLLTIECDIEVSFYSVVMPAVLLKSYISLLEREIILLMFQCLGDNLNLQQ